jgi:hypothetical protein
VEYTCNPSYSEGGNKRIANQSQPHQKDETLCEKDKLKTKKLEA